MTSSKKKDKGDRLAYEPPKLFNLGGSVVYAAAPCNPGGSPTGGNCSTGATATTGGCQTGNAAGGKCQGGQAAAGGKCQTGATAAGNCQAGGSPQ